MKSFQFKLKVGLTCCAIVALLCPIGLVTGRFWLWQRFPHLRPAIAYVLELFPPREKTLSTVAALMGRADKVEHYAMCEIDAVDQKGRRADIVLSLDAANRVANIAFAWKDLSLTSTQRFSMHAWRNENAQARAAMAADLIQRWHNGELRNELGDYLNATNLLAGTRLISEAHYSLPNWKCLVIAFDAKGLSCRATVVDD